MTARIETATAILQGRAHGRVTPGGALAPFTSYRLGGPAGVLLEASSVEDLDALSTAIAETGLDLLIVGRGSNMLISDSGFDGIALRLGAGFRWERIEGQNITAGAAMPLPSLSTLAMHETLSGLEFASAIPASLGGAVRMNAGAHARQMSDVLTRIEVYLPGEGSRWIESEDAGLVYRGSSLPSGAIVVAATLGLAVAPLEQIVDLMNEAKDWRRATQPLNLPNGGSVFKNPPGDHAARLVEQVCGKGMAEGGARISEVHANFIVTSPGARAADVHTLIARIRTMVAEQTGVTLEPEIKLIGDFTEGTP